MTSLDCIKQTALESTQRILKLTKVVKPMLRFLARKGHKTNVVTPSTCNYDVVESTQNDLNESELFQLHFKFYDEMRAGGECEDNSRNEELENRLRESAADKDLAVLGVRRVVNGQMVVEPVANGTYLAVPVHFVEGPAGGFAWAPLPDGDVCRRGDESPICGNQTPEQQVPVFVATA